MKQCILGVVGCGQMGRGIAQVAAQHGHEVKLFDVSSEALQEARRFIADQLNKGVQKGKWDGVHAETAMGKLHLAHELDQLQDCQVVIEAATERKDLKFKIFKDLDSVIRPDAILASNTSSISITEIASHTKRPEKVIGMHFMNPVPVMRLVEGIVGNRTSEDTRSQIQELAESWGKIFICARDMPGFAVNRILMPMINEAIYALFESIANEKDIDQAMKLGCNFPMGPLELADFIGLDTCLSILEVLHQGLGDPKYRPCPLLKQYVAAGRLGKKSGMGFYSYR